MDCAKTLELIKIFFERFLLAGTPKLLWQKTKA
jgi:hypothetical protein